MRARTPIADNSYYRKEPGPHRTKSQIAALSFVIAGIILLIWGTTGFYWIVAATLFSFLAAFFEVWILIIEINR